MRTYKRDNSPYYWMEYRDGKGKLQRKSTKRKLKKEADIVLHEAVKIALDESQFGKRPERTIGEVADHYITRADMVSESEGRLARHFIGKLLARGDWAERKDKDTHSYSFHIDDSLLMSQINSGHFAALQAARHAEGMKNKTVNHEVSWFKSLYLYARDVLCIQVDREVRFPKKLKETPRTRAASREEVERLLAELDPNRFIPQLDSQTSKERGDWMHYRGELTQRRLQDQYDLTVVLLSTGLRYTEAATLTWAQVDITTYSWLTPDRLKGGHDNTIHLPKRAREVLERRHTKRQHRSRFVFPSIENDERARGHATKGISNAIERAGLNADPSVVAKQGRFTVHSLRDTFASECVRRGMTLYEVQELLGHSSPAMTQKYAKLMRGDTTKKAAVLMDDFL